MSAIDTVQERILEGAEQLFMRFGVRSISMDEVARHLAMSKKTLYQYFDNKDELVYQMAQRKMTTSCAEWDKVHQANLHKSALEETLLVGDMMRKKATEVNHVVLYEIRRFHPRAWRVFETMRSELMERSVMSNLERGQQEGYYLPSINTKIVARCRVMQVTMSLDPEVFPPSDFDFAQVQDQLLDHFVRGLLTPLGAQEWARLRQSSTTQPQTAFA
jgi:AcrR family transcriptional regulator